MWKTSEWFRAPTFTAYRHGRHIVAELSGRHQVLSTSPYVGGMQEDIRFLVNHQSCEGTGHNAKHDEISALGLDGYHCKVCGDLDLDPKASAVMGTAANMIYAARSVQAFGDLQVDAIVTAGVEGNAVCAGDPAQWVETSDGWNKIPHVAGTINAIVVVNQPVAPEALVRALMTVTEGKSAALSELGVSSRYSEDLATGTGTDQICIASPMKDGYALRSASPHTKLGELLGLAARAATREALRWQNGLEPSLTRSLFHALRRFGFREDRFVEAMKSRLSPPSFELFEKNKNAVLYEPQTAAAAYAFAGVYDRMRYGVLPPDASNATLRQHAATIAVSLSGKPEAWPVFWKKLNVNSDRPLDSIYDAIALGWSAKWTTAD